MPILPILCVCENPDGSFMLGVSCKGSYTRQLHACSAAINMAICWNLIFKRVFSKCTRMAIIPILTSEALFRENKNIQLQNVTPGGNRTPAASDYKSNMLLSTLTWHLLVTLRLYVPYIFIALLIPLKS